MNNNEPVAVKEPAALPNLPKEYKKTVTLPLSGKVVTLIAPTWKQRKEAKRDARMLKLDDEATSMHLMAKSTYIDGEFLLTEEDFDSWQTHDVMHLFDEFNEWNETAGPGGKN